MAGVWAGGGTVTLDDGSRERLRCRANYAVEGNSLTMNLTCASDAYKFDLRAGVVSEGGAISGTWSETSRNIGGNLAGRGGAGNFQVLASAAGLQRQYQSAHRRQEAVDCDPRRQRVPRRRHFAVEVTPGSTDIHALGSIPRVFLWITRFWDSRALPRFP